MLLCVKWCKKR